MIIHKLKTEYCKNLQPSNTILILKIVFVKGVFPIPFLRNRWWNGRKTP
jgi:hypothetical protein